jgi:hypothetical protein
MPLSTEKLPNRALSGEELGEILIEEFRRIIARDYRFLKTVAYKRAAATILLTVDLGYPHPVMEGKSRLAGLVAEAPITPEPEEHEVAATEVSVKLENPNLDRVHHGLPIKVQRALPPEPPKMPDVIVPGETPEPSALNFKGFETQEFKYDPKDMPAVAAPVVTDVSEREAMRMGVKVKRGLGYIPEAGRAARKPEEAE